MASLSARWAKSELAGLLAKDTEVTEDDSQGCDVVLHLSTPIRVALHWHAAMDVHCIFVGESDFHAVRMAAKQQNPPPTVMPYTSLSHLSGLLLTLQRAHDPSRLAKLQALHAQRRSDAYAEVVQSL